MTACAGSRMPLLWLWSQWPLQSHGRAGTWQGKDMAVQGLVVHGLAGRTHGQLRTCRPALPIDSAGTGAAPHVLAMAATWSRNAHLSSDGCRTSLATHPQLEWPHIEQTQQPSRRT